MIEERAREIIAVYDAMTTEQQKEAHRLMQRRSWVIGQMLLSHPELTRQQVERIVDQASGALSNK